MNAAGQFTDTPLPLSVVIIAGNAADKIAAAITSAQFANEVLVVDSLSTDDTVGIAQRLGAHVIQRAWLGFSQQKQFAVDAAQHDWVFILDSDERITPELRDEIRRTLQQPTAQAYRVARRNYFFGKFMRYGGLFPDYSVRLVDRRLGRFNTVALHEQFISTGTEGTLQQPMTHLAFDSIDQFITKTNRYSSLNSQRCLLRALLRPLWRLFSMYVLRLGFLDGREGLIVAVLYSQTTFWKYTK